MNKPTHTLTKTGIIDPASTGVKLHEDCYGWPVDWTLKIGSSFYFTRKDGLVRITSPIESIKRIDKKTRLITTLNSKYTLVKVN